MRWPHLLGLTSGLVSVSSVLPKIVVELPSSPCPVLTRIVEAKVAAGIRVPLVVVDMPAVELGRPVPTACTAP